MKAASVIKKLRESDNGFAAAIGGVSAVLISILIVIVIYWKMSLSVSDGMGVSVVAHRAMNATNSTATSVFTLAPIIGIVMIAGIILMIVTRFGQNQP